MKVLQNEAKDYFAILDIKADIDVSYHDGAYVINATVTDDPAPLIGYHAENLNALQRLIIISSYQKINDKIDVLLDINNYRARQKERIEGIAQSTAERVISSKASISLRDFDPYERKLVHQFISTHFPDLITTSEGEGNDRKLVVRKK